ncbi:MucBP domain-containing protein [Aerococcus urinae]|uniref:MucBP domain-containing protein n=1 Tax=Aerococcus urinae TaxID=1376 RepID=UPI00227C405B|nr:MucBP domain-containing protein [Aerococcus urinae]MCY3060794.1 MucBP domain-containing protein [Aerococcus urinae]
MEKFAKIINRKKQESSNKKKRYGIRKLSIGIVSCALGCWILASSDTVYAQENTPSTGNQVSAPANQKAVYPEDKAKLSENTSKNMEVDADKTKPAELTAKENKSVTPEKESQAAVKPSLDEAVKNPENVPVSVSRNAKKETPKLASRASEEYNNDLTHRPAKEDEVKATTYDVSDKDLENSEEVNTNKPRDISRDVPKLELSINKENDSDTLQAVDGEALPFSAFFVTPKGTKEGDTFTLTVSDNYSLKGIEPESNQVPDIVSEDAVIAKGRKEGNKIIYTFTKAINDRPRAFAVFALTGFDNKKVIKNSSNQTFKIQAGDKSAVKNLYVNYGQPYRKGKLNINSQFTEWNKDTGEFTQVFYVNPKSETIRSGLNGIFENSVGMVVHNGGREAYNVLAVPSDVFYDAVNTKVEIKKIQKGVQLPDAVYENPAEGVTIKDSEINYNNGKLYINFKKRQIDSPYVVVVKSKAKSRDGIDYNLYSSGVLHGDDGIPGEVYSWVESHNVIHNFNDKAMGGTKNDGYFVEHHIYYTRVNGKIDKSQTFEMSSNTLKGGIDNYYVTSKQEFEDYKFSHVDRKKLINLPRYNENGEPQEDNYIPGRKKEITYVYFRDIKQEDKNGSFQEHHIYRTVDEEGNVISTDESKDNEVTSGKSDQIYTTSKQDRDGYKLVSVTPSNEESKKSGVKFSKDGQETRGNYLSDKKLEVTYVYERVQKTKGSFQEHHIYRTVDEDGNVISTDETKDNEVTSGKTDQSYTTSKQDKAGYKLVSVSPSNEESKTLGVKYAKNGQETKGNYVSDKKLEVTYVYERVQKTKGSFQEHHIYRTVDEDGNVISTDETKDNEVTSGKTDQSYTTSKQDKAGYKLVSVTPSNEESKNSGVKFSKDGQETKGNYVSDKKLEVTYVYERVQKTKGSFQEHHIYRTVDEDGNVISTDETKDNEVTSGKSDQSYTTSKQDKDGYKLVSVTPTNEDSKNSDVKFSKDGQETKGNYVSDKKLEVTYVYERVQKTKGSFQEHHIYRTVDEDGKVISTDETRDNEVTSGKSNQTYTTSKQDKDGYKLVSVTPSNKESETLGVKFSKDGQNTKGNYVADKKLGVTYVYERVQKTKGSFQEHHIYRTVDEDGNVISTDETKDNEVTSGKTDQSYTTSKQDKDGYKLVSVMPTNEDSKKSGVKFSKDGQKTKGNYVSDKKLEVTYVYERVQRTKGSFQEHHIYRTVDEDGNVISTDEIKDNEVTTGKVDQTYTTSKQDKDGYKLVSVAPSNEESKKSGVKYAKDGQETKGNYIPDKKLEVTYIYERLLKSENTIVEHHSHPKEDKDKMISTKEKTTDHSQKIVLEQSKVSVMKSTAQTIKQSTLPASAPATPKLTTVEETAAGTRKDTQESSAHTSLPKTGVVAEPVAIEVLLVLAGALLAIPIKRKNNQ